MMVSAGELSIQETLKGEICYKKIIQNRYYD